MRYNHGEKLHSGNTRNHARVLGNFRDKLGIKKYIMQEKGCQSFTERIGTVIPLRNLATQKMLKFSKLLGKCHRVMECFDGSWLIRQRAIIELLKPTTLQV